MSDDRFMSQSSSSRSVSVDAGLKAHMQRIYNRMTLGVLVTAVVSYLVAASPALMQLFLGGPQAYVVMLAPLAIIFFGFNPAKMSANAMRVSFLAISVIYGISFAAIFHVFTGESIAKAFFVAAGMFAGISIFGYTTKKNLDGLGSFAVMGMWGLIILGLVNIFVESSLMGNVISAAGIIVFAGLTAWETQNMKEMYSSRMDSEIASRMSWMGALNLYISFIAMFQHILHFMGNRE
ncbi:MAG TPA: Bax inhibitor-1/YccA family protein [Alphaproteobacteria bacterium]|nr:Bax inhibitor-1/YccA family protein [Alphaproteobacteria bacterium]